MNVAGSILDLTIPVEFEFRKRDGSTVTEICSSYETVAKFKKYHNAFYARPKKNGGSYDASVSYSA